MIGIGTIQFALRLLLAIGMGALVGLERQWRQRMAGRPGFRHDARPSRLLSCRSFGKARAGQDRKAPQIFDTEHRPSPF